MTPRLAYSSFAPREFFISALSLQRRIEWDDACYEPIVFLYSMLYPLHIARLMQRLHAW